MVNNESNNDEFSVDSFDEFEQQLNQGVEKTKDIIKQSQTLINNPNSNSNNQDNIENKILDLIEVFLLNYKNGFYFNRIRNIIQEQKESLIIDYNDLIEYDSFLTEYLDSNPIEGIADFKTVLYKIDATHNFNYFDPKKYFGIRYINYPYEEKIKNVDVRKINTLRSLRGLVAKTTEKKPYIFKYCLKCPDCGNEIYLDYDSENCFNKDCEKKPSMKLMKNKHIYTNVMFIRIQELSEDSVSQIPQSIDCMVLGDLVEEIEAGQKVIVTGFILLRDVIKKMSKRTPYIVSVMVNNVQQFTSNDLNLISKVYLTEKDEKRFDELSKLDNWLDILLDSFCSQVYGLKNVKLGCCLAITGAGELIIDGEQFRDRIHLLLCTDPSLAKSKLLRFIKRIILGSVLATGKGSSGGGLTAMTLKEPDGTFSVVPGSLVFANKNIFMFDEADKVGDEVRSHLHESMEDGTITLNKGGQAVTLQALTTTIFAANPRYSRYQNDLSLSENINLPHSLISRFDLVFVIKDSTEHDKEITDHINYMYKYKTVPNRHSLLSTEDLIKYFLYVKKRNIDPEIPDHIYDKMQQNYFKLRSQSTEETIAYTTRQYEGGLRKCKALARFLLREIVNDKMANRIIELDQSQLDTIGKEPDGTLNAAFAEGKSRKTLGDTKFIINIMEELAKEHDKNKIPISKLKDTLTDNHNMKEKEADKLIKKVKEDGLILDNGESFVRLAKYA